MAGANGLSRPTLGTVGTVTEFRGSLAPNQRRRQAKYENAEKDRISHTHCNSKTLSDSPKSVKAGRSEWMTKPLLGLSALNVSTNLANTNDKPVKAVGEHRSAKQHEEGIDQHATSLQELRFCVNSAIASPSISID
jgi:hypothetical protein